MQIADRRKPQYAAAKLALPDALRFVDALFEVGCKDPRYSASLRQLSDPHNLRQFDWRAPSAGGVAGLGGQNWPCARECSYAVIATS